MTPQPTQLCHENRHKTLLEKIEYIEQSYPRVSVLICTSEATTLAGNATLHPHLVNALPYISTFLPGHSGSIHLFSRHVRLSWSRHEHVIVIMSWERAPSEKARSFEKSISRTIRSIVRLSKMQWQSAI